MFALFKILSKAGVVLSGAQATGPMVVKLNLSRRVAELSYYLEEIFFSFLIGSCICLDGSEL